MKPSNSDPFVSVSPVQLETASQYREPNPIELAEVWSGRLAMLGVTTILVAIAWQANI